MLVLPALDNMCHVGASATFVTCPPHPTSEGADMSNQAIEVNTLSLVAKPSG
jgi:hypothetical protein